MLPRLKSFWNRWLDLIYGVPVLYRTQVDRKEGIDWTLYLHSYKRPRSSRICKWMGEFIRDS